MKRDGENARSGDITESTVYPACLVHGVFFYEKLQLTTKKVSRAQENLPDRYYSVCQLSGSRK